ncbi:MAG: hypothetical protein BA874_06420 [Desulfuromonadales bacterium C00003068]|jgi:hypothetical protein|nr:MAG: hypothetical protein BA874_06420 [Desulfuromonadales bacterium C00003068]
MPNLKKQILIVDDTQSNIDALVATLGNDHDLRKVLSIKVKLSSGRLGICIAPLAKDDAQDMTRETSWQD